MKSMEQIFERLENLGITIYTYREMGKFGGYELNTYTDAGVNMIVFVDYRNTKMNPKNPKHFIELFTERVNDIDIDEELRVHLEDKRYRDEIGAVIGAQDFKDWKENLQSIFAEPTPHDKALALLQEVKQKQEDWEREICEICEASKYKESSLFSYNIDKLRQFVQYLEESTNRIK